MDRRSFFIFHYLALGHRLHTLVLFQEVTEAINLMCQSNNYIEHISLTWPDPIFVQGRYRLQYKHPAQKGSGPVHRPDWNRNHHHGGGC